MNFTNYSSNDNHSNFSIQYLPQLSLIYPQEQMVRINPLSIQTQSLTRVSESSSGVEIFDNESMETSSSDSDPLIIRCNSSESSSTTYSRKVIIKSTDQTVTISNKRRRRRRRRKLRFQQKQQNIFLDKKESISPQQPSSRYKRRHRSSERWNHKEDRLKRLFDKYSSEEIDKEWKPLMFPETRELYEYAFDIYHKKI